MDSISLLDSVGLLSALQLLNKDTDPMRSFGSTDDILDPYGVYRAQGVDPYGNQLVEGGYLGRPDGPAKSSRGRAASNVGSQVKSATSGPISKLTALGDMYATAVDPVIRNQTAAVGKGVRGASKAMGFAPSAAGNAGRMAMTVMRNPMMKGLLRVAPGVGAALSVGDLVVGDESLANKGMDAALMAAGGTIGSVVPVVGTALGIAGGKLISDGTQFLFGGGKSPEERRMEEALLALRGGLI